MTSNCVTKPLNICLLQVAKGLAMALGQAGKFAIVLTIPGVLAFVLGIIAENKKVRVKNKSCCIKGAPSVVIKQVNLLIGYCCIQSVMFFLFGARNSSARWTDLHRAEHVETISVSSCLICLW